MCISDMRILEGHKKLYLVVDLDHTLLNSSGINDMTTDEDYLENPNPRQRKSSSLGGIYGIDD